MDRLLPRLLLQLSFVLFSSRSLIAAGVPSPPFIAISISGQTVTTESLNGSTILVEFWATWCRFCRHDEPFIDRLTDEINSPRFSVLAVNVNESRRVVADYVTRNARKSMIILAENTNLVDIYKPRSLPQYALIDHAGSVIAVRRGALTPTALVGLRSAVLKDLSETIHVK